MNPLNQPVNKYSSRTVYYGPLLIWAENDEKAPPCQGAKNAIDYDWNWDI